MATPALSSLLDEACATLRQLTHFVEGLTSAHYTAPHGQDARHTIGKHVRHILDHYEALLAWKATATTATIDYEHRQRAPALEQHPEIALEHLQRLIERLTWLHAGDTPRRLAHLAYHAGGQAWSLTSSLERELAFLTSHAIHHMAIIALLADSQGVDTPQTFGVHPSTLRHWQHVSQPAQEVQS